MFFHLRTVLFGSSGMLSGVADSCFQLPWVQLSRYFPCVSVLLNTHTHTHTHTHTDSLSLSLSLSPSPSLPLSLFPPLSQSSQAQLTEGMHCVFSVSSSHKPTGTLSRLCCSSSLEWPSIQTASSYWMGGRWAPVTHTHTHIHTHTYQKSSLFLTYHFFPPFSAQ